MQYDNEYDLDHNDCPEYETEFPGEFAPDVLVETGTDQCDELGTTEYDEQVATDLSDLYETDETDAEKTYNGDAVNYDSENAEENDSIDWPGTTINNSPSDEQAATRDECYNNDNCHCKSAQEKCQLDDYEIISDVLGSEKQIVKLYSTALCETAEENLRDIIRENFTEAAADQYKAFSFMQSKGMYKTEQATEEDITQAKQQFSSIN